MPISVDWPTAVITIPQSYMTLLGGGIYELDIDQFRKDLNDLQDDEEGIAWPTTHTHDTETTISGTTFVRKVVILSPYTVAITPAGGWVVSCTGANHNIQDVYTNLTGPTFLPNNSAGLVRTDVAEKPTEGHIAAAYNNPTSLLRMTVWVVRLGAQVLVPTSCVVKWYNPDGTLLFTVANSGAADAQGVFQIDRASTLLVSNTAYYAEITVTDASGTVVTTRGVPTGP